MAALVPGVAASDTPHGKPAPFQRTMTFHGFPGVVGAGGREPALVANERRQGQLIDPDQGDQDVLGRVQSWVSWRR